MDSYAVTPTCFDGVEYLCMTARQAKQLLEVVYKVHDPFAFSLFVLFALPVSDTLDVLCRRTKTRLDINVMWLTF